MIYAASEDNSLYSNTRNPIPKTVGVQLAHPLVVDPIFEELERILLIMQNEDGSWGTAESLDDRLYATGWAVMALASQNIVSPLNKTFELIQSKVVPQLEEQFKPLILTHIRKLCGLFLLLPSIYQKRLWNNASLFDANLKQLLSFLMKKEWLSEMVAGCFAFSCAPIKQLEVYVNHARQHLSGLAKPQPKDVYRFIGNPRIVRECLKKSEFVEKLNSQINSLTDEQLVHLLLAFSAIQQGNETSVSEILSNVKQKLIEHIQTRQLSELDKKVTKESLDLVSTGMKSNLLILDEPTDGFSKEQLFKVRDILGEIKCPQVIIVSHERELESFADQVLKVEKAESVSKISSLEVVSNDICEES